MGKKDMFRSRAIRCRNEKYSSFARWEEVRNDPKVLAISENVRNKRKRTFKCTRNVSTRIMASAGRTESRASFIAGFVPKQLATAADLTLQEIALNNGHGESNGASNNDNIASNEDNNASNNDDNSQLN
jgi:hypothetical protein